MVGPRFLISLLALIAASLPARASLVFYNTAPSFNTALLTASDALGPVISFTQFVGVTGSTETDSVTGTVFSTPTGSLDGITNPGGSWPSAVLERTSNGSEIDITLPAGTVAFEIYVGEVGSTVDDVTLSAASSTTCQSPGTLSGGYCFDPSVTPANNQSPVFIGAISDTAITSIHFSSDNNFEQLGISGLDLGAAGDAETPETTTSLLIGSGLILMRVLRKRSLRRKMERSGSREEASAPCEQDATHLHLAV